MTTLTVYYVVDMDGSAWLFPEIEPVFDRGRGQWRRPYNLHRRTEKETHEDKNRPCPCRIDADCQWTAHDGPQKRHMSLKKYKNFMSAFRGE